METRARKHRANGRNESPTRIRRVKKSKRAVGLSNNTSNDGPTPDVGSGGDELATAGDSGAGAESEEQIDDEIESLTAQIEARKKLLDQMASNSAMEMKKKLRDDLIRQLNDIGEISSSASNISQSAPGGQKIFLDKDGKCYMYHEKAGVVADLDASQAFRRVCEDSRHRILLKRDGMRLESDHVRNYFILHCELASSSSQSLSYCKDLLTTVSLWKTLSNLPVCSEKKFHTFLSFSSVMYSYHILSLQDFISTGSVESDYLTLAMALQNMEDFYCCVFGEAWSGFCSGIIRQLKTDTLIHRRSIQFVRYQLEQLYWVFSYDMINFHYDPAQHESNYANTEDCVSQFVMLLNNLQLEADDESYFNRFISPKLSHNLKDSRVPINQTTLVKPAIRKTVQFAPVHPSSSSTNGAASANSPSHSQRVCLANMLFDLRVPTNGHTLTPCRFGNICKYDHVKSTKDVSEILLKTVKINRKRLSQVVVDAATVAIANLA